MGRAAQYQEAGVEGVLDGRYRLRREIARGGHGAVFEAEHLVTHATVAIKTLAQPALDQPSAHDHLFHEGRILAAPRHPNAMTIHDAGTCPIHGPYLVFELIEGRSLEGILLTRQRLGIAQTIALAVQLAAALDPVHRQGIVHRNVKPSNLLVTRATASDQIKLIGFGGAKLRSARNSEPEALRKSDEVLGSVEYMAPEQIMGTTPVDARSDIYAAGVVIHECLMGEVLYSGLASTVIAEMLASTRPVAIRARREDVPEALEAAIRRACEIEPGRRFSSVADFARACVAAHAGEVPVLDLLEASAATEKLGHRRQYARAPYVTPVRMLMAQGVTEGRTEDLSEGGVLIVAESAYSDGEQVKLRLPLPVTGRIVELDATTKWTKTRRNQRAIGAEFVDPPKDIRAAIRAYVERMSDRP